MGVVTQENWWGTLMSGATFKGKALALHQKTDEQMWTYVLSYNKHFYYITFMSPYFNQYFLLKNHVSDQNASTII